MTGAKGRGMTGVVYGCGCMCVAVMVRVGVGVCVLL